MSENILGKIWYLRTVEKHKTSKDKKVTVDDISLLKTCSISDVSYKEMYEVCNSIELFPLNAQVDDWNLKQVFSLEETV